MNVLDVFWNYGTCSTVRLKDINFLSPSHSRCFRYLFLLDQYLYSLPLTLKKNFVFGGFKRGVRTAGAVYLLKQRRNRCLKCGLNDQAARGLHQLISRPFLCKIKIIRLEFFVSV